MATDLVSRTLRVGSFHTSYFEAGDPDSPTIVLVHDGAWGADARASWSSVAEELADSWHVIAPDLLGFGATAKAVFFDTSRFAFRWRHICDLLDLLEVEAPVHAAGASFGGSLVLRAAAQEAGSHRLRSVASVSGTGGPYRRAEVFKNLTAFDGTDEAMRRIMSYLVDDFEGVSDQVKQRQRNVRLAGHHEAMSAVRMEAFEGGQRPSDPADPFPDSLMASSVPFLLFEGERDELLERGWAGRITEAVGRGAVITLDSRHSPNIDHPEDIAHALHDFFLSVDAAP